MLQITCAQDYACSEMVIAASETRAFTLDGCESGALPCRGITVSCPPNMNGNPQCTINGINTCV